MIIEPLTTLSGGILGRSIARVIQFRAMKNSTVLSNHRWAIRWWQTLRRWLLGWSRYRAYSWRVLKQPWGSGHQEHVQFYSRKSGS